MSKMPDIKGETLTKSLANINLGIDTKSKAKGEIKEEDLKKKDEPDKKKLTLYQGKRRSFGWFNCKDCKISWTSANSWANTYQKCKKCNREIYPFRQVRFYGYLKGAGKSLEIFYIIFTDKSIFQRY